MSDRYNHEKTDREMLARHGRDDTELKWYECRSEGGTFWIRAPRASDAVRLRHAIMTADPEAVYMFRTTDIGFIDMAETGPSPVTSHRDAEQRMSAWAFAGHRGHDFDEPGEKLCRVCGSTEDGIQHRPDYPREAH